MAEQIRQKRLGLQVFKAFIFNASLDVQTPALFTITRYKNLDISALQGKKCQGTVLTIGLEGLLFECPLKLPTGSVLKLSVELPVLGPTTIEASIRDVESREGKYYVSTDYCREYNGIRDCILRQLARDFDLSGKNT
jgi:hypothetical protein